MSNARVTRMAIANNQQYQSDKFRYGAVDGRCYQMETPLAAPARPLSECEITRLKTHDQMSMIEIYRMELFLQDGKRPSRKATPKTADKDRIVKEYGLVLDTRCSRYLGDYAKVWEIMTQKFPNAARGYKGYKECQYAVKYGAQPCCWSAAK